MPTLIAHLWLAATALAAEPSCPSVTARLAFPKAKAAVVEATSKVIENAFRRDLGGPRFVAVSQVRCAAHTRDALAPQRCRPSFRLKDASPGTPGTQYRTVFLTDEFVATGKGRCVSRGEGEGVVVRCDTDPQGVSGEQWSHNADFEGDLKGAFEWIIASGEDPAETAACAAKTAAAPAIPLVPGEVPPMGALAREQIDQVIKGRMTEVMRCMLEVEVLRAGRFEVRFVISPTGTVSSAMAIRSTLSAARVEECVAEQFGLMRFPEPNGGGIVIVTYPFVFGL